MFRSAGLPGLLVLILCARSVALAQTFSHVEELLERRQFAEAESLLTKELRVNPENDSAHYFMGQIPVRSRAVNRYDEAIEHMKKCVAAKPNSSEYQLWLGRAYGVKAQEAGIFSAMGYVGDIKAAFRKSAELDPHNFDARYDLIQMYLQLPGIAGGSVSKAKEIAEDYGKGHPELAPLLWAAIYVYDEDFDEALKSTALVAIPTDTKMLGYYRNTITSIGFSLLTEEEPEKAEPVFKRFVGEFPELAIGYHGLGRCSLDLGKTDEAIGYFEKALAIDSAVGSQYRLGIAFQKKGDKAKAKKYLEEFISLTPPRDAKAVEDAKERLSSLE